MKIVNKEVLKKWREEQISTKINKNNEKKSSLKYGLEDNSESNPDSNIA